MGHVVPNVQAEMIIVAHDGLLSDASKSLVKVGCLYKTLPLNIGVILG